MLRALMVLLVLTSLPVCAGGDSLSMRSWGFFASYSYGYTHYLAKDLNDVMQALERQSAEAAGLNHYQVDNFNGHPRQAAMLGWFWRKWSLGLEAEAWVEDFRQHNIPFYMNRDLDTRFTPDARISCADLHAPGFEPVQGGTAGCIDAQEIFNIVPLTLQLGRSFPLWRERLWLTAGLGAGVLAGDARLIVTTDFLGQDSRPDDTLDVVLYPGVNLVGKAFLELEYRPIPFLGISLKGGYRHSGMDHVEIRDKKGESFLFGLILTNDGTITNGDRAYLIRSQASGQDQLVLRAPPTQAEIHAASLSGSSFTPVQGDFSGWMLELKVNCWLDIGRLRR